MGESGVYEERVKWWEEKSGDVGESGKGKERMVGESGVYEERVKWWG